MRELRCYIDAVMASRRHRSLSVQRLRPLPQDERHEPATCQTASPTGTAL